MEITNHCTLKVFDRNEVRVIPTRFIDSVKMTTKGDRATVRVNALKLSSVTHVAAAMPSDTASRLINRYSTCTGILIPENK